MSFVAINPKYRPHLDRQGLTEAGHFLALPGVIVTGHPQRHVLQLTLGQGPDALAVFLKKEHRVCWKDRLASAWAGFGLVSKSCREAATLQALAGVGGACPEWIAAGEDDTGQAFLLVRELAGGLDLRHFLHQQPFPSSQRRRWARSLGEALARLHAAGFNHPDLYSKHVLVHPADGRISFLDWQRSRRWTRVSWHRRGRDLAALNATLADDLASSRERLVCFRAYCRAANFRGNRWRMGELILHQSARLLKRRHIREMRQPPLRTGAQSLIWLEGEALCVTPEFHALLQGQLPSGLKPAGRLEGFPPSEGSRKPSGQVVHSVVPIPGGRIARLVCRQVDRPRSRLMRLLNLFARIGDTSLTRERRIAASFARASGLCRRCARGHKGRQPVPSPELEQVGLLYRLQRYGLATPKLLAFGQCTLPGRTESFLLTEPLSESVGLLDWLADQAGRILRPAERRRRWRLIRAAAAVLQVIHASGCELDPAVADPATQLCVRCSDDGDVTMGLGHVAGLRQCRRGQPAPTIRDLVRVFETLPAGLGSRTEALRFLLAYLGQRRLTAAAKRSVRLILQRTSSPQQVTLWTSPCAMRACCPPVVAARRTLPT